MPTERELMASVRGAATMGIIGMVILFYIGAPWYLAVWFWVGMWLGRYVGWREARMGAGEYGGIVSAAIGASAWVAGVVGTVMALRS